MTLTEKKELVARFLTRCNEYADTKLAEYHSRMRSQDANQALALADKIAHWSAYKAFNEFAIAELATPALDDWFD